MPKSPELHKQWIIVADDHLINLEMLKHSLGTLQLIPQTIFCNNGQDAIESFKEKVLSVVQEVARKHAGNCNVVKLKPVALMLLDLQMPIKNGIEVVNWINRFCQGIAARHKGFEIE